MSKYKFPFVLVAPVNYDEQEADDPRADDDGLMGTIYYVSSRYTLGDEQVDPETIRAIEEDPETISLPVYAYIHGGTVLSTGSFNDRWDSGQSGIIATTKKRARDLRCWKRITAARHKIILDELHQEVSDYSAWLNAAVYHIYFVDQNDDGTAYVSLEWTIYGYDADDKARTYAQGVANYQRVPVTVYELDVDFESAPHSGEDFMASEIDEETLPLKEIDYCEPENEV